MSENRKYYFLKLKDDFFEQDTIVLLESMQDGILYSNILMKMYLKALQYDGYLKVNEQLPMTPEMIATLTRHEVGTVERALKVLMQLGLVETTETGTLYMSQIETLIGKSSSEAERKANARRRLLEASTKPPSIGTSETGADICPNLSADCPPSVRDLSADCPNLSAFCPPEIRDKSIEIREEKRESRERTDKTPPARTESPQEKYSIYGKYNNVRLTDADLVILKADYPNDYEDMIEHLSEYIASTGREYQNHLATMERWKKDDERKGKNGGDRPVKKNSFNDYQQREYDYAALEKQLLANGGGANE